MLSERLLTKAVEFCTASYLHLAPVVENERMMPPPQPNKSYMLYMHVPFCERLCPYCSFNRFPYAEDRARPYFANMRKEMQMLAELGYDFDSIYIGGGTPTILLDELCQTIDLARETFTIKEVSCETNPNHLIPEYIEQLEGRVQRLSVGVQSFDNDLLRQMDRFDKYGSGEEILERIQFATPFFQSLNADMIFNFPAQTVDTLIADIERVVESGASQATFYPLMASPSVQKSLRETVGAVDYEREQMYYNIICELLLGKDEKSGPFSLGSAWTFNRKPTLGVTADEAEGCMVEHRLGSAKGASKSTRCEASELVRSDDASVRDFAPSASNYYAIPMIDEYVVNYEEYPAIGSGGITYLGDTLYVNTFSVNEYNAAIESGCMSMMGATRFSARDRMLYRFMMQLFGLRLDKRQFKKDFGVSIERGLPLELAFMRTAGAFATDDADELTLTPKGRYLVVVMMRQFFIGVNGLRDQARAALTGEERHLIFG